MIRLCAVFALGIGIAGFLLAVPSELGESDLIGWVLLAVMIALLLGTYILVPHYCVVNAQGITIGYGFGLKETAKWEQIRKIYLDFDASRRGVLRSKYVYCFVGMEGKKTFYMASEFPKTEKFEKILLKYAKDKAPTKY